jgi:hypothetical protein
VRTARIFLIGTAGLCAAVLLRFWLQWAVLAFTALPLAFIVVGQFYLPHSKQSIRVWMNPDLLEHMDALSLRLSGKEISLGFFKRWYEFEIEVHNRWLLAILAFASLGEMALIWKTNELPMPNAYWGCGVPSWSLVCYLAWRWLWERRAMSKSGFALGDFRIAGMAGRFLKRVVYHFVNSHGEYHGGSFRTLFCDTSDDLTVIFYNEAKPEISVPASAMMFHRLNWTRPSE